MESEKVPGSVLVFAKSAFLKVMNEVFAVNPQNCKEIEKILSDKTKDLKTIDTKCLKQHMECNLIEIYTP